MRARRTAATVAVAAALAVGQQVTSRLELGPSQADDEPFVTRAALGEVAHLPYADAEVTDVRPARYVAPRGSTELVRRADGVYVLVSVAVTARTEPTTFTAAYLLDAQGRQHYTSAKAGCASSVATQTGIPAYALLCFDVPPAALAGLRLQLARGSLTWHTTQGDALADLDLGISAAEEESWPATEDAYGQEQSTREPFELQPVTLEEAPS